MADAFTIARGASLLEGVKTPAEAYQKLRSAGWSEADIQKFSQGTGIYIGPSNGAVVTAPNGTQTVHAGSTDGDGFSQVPKGVSLGDWQAMSPEEKLVQQMISDAKDTRDTNRGAVLGGFGDVQQGQKDASTFTNGATQDVLRQQKANNDWAMQTDVGYQNLIDQNSQRANAFDAQTYQGLMGALGDSTSRNKAAVSGLANAAGGANIQGQQNLAGLNTATLGANRADAASLGALSNTYAGINHNIQTQGYGANLNSAAAGAKADARDVNAQHSILDQLVGQANAPGLTSTAAGAKANAGDVSRQLDAANRFSDFGDGAGDIESQAAGAYADPESVEGQRWAMSKYKDLSDPSLTAQERLMMEQARREEERGQQAALGAAMRDLESRGIRSGGAEIGALLGSGQNTSETRMLRDMAAAAQAQQRSLAAIGAYNTSAGNMRNASFGEALQRGQSADAMGVGNRDAQLDSLGQFADIATTARGQGFGEQFQAGQAGDAMANANRGYKLSALGQGADLATTARGQGFNEQFQAGQAGDQMAQFNKSASLSQANYQAELARQQQVSAMNDALSMNNANMSASDAAYGRAGNMYDAQGKLITDQYARGQDIYKAQTDTANTDFSNANTVADKGSALNTSSYNRNQNTAASGIELTNQNLNRANSQLTGQQAAIDKNYQMERDRQGNTIGFTGMYTGQGSSDGRAVTDANKTSVGQIESQKASDLLNKPPFNPLDPESWF